MESRKGRSWDKDAVVKEQSMKEGSKGLTVEHSLLGNSPLMEGKSQRIHVQMHFKDESI